MNEEIKKQEKTEEEEEGELQATFEVRSNEFRLNWE